MDATGLKHPAHGLNAKASQVVQLALSVLLFVSAASAGAHQLGGRVVAVADGDTITVLDSEERQHKVRLSGIDAPEKRQAYGTRSREHLAALLFGRRVDIEFKKTDRYGRVVGKVFVADVDAGLQQVQAGMAWHYRAYAREQPPLDREAYAAAEEEARGAGRGLWAKKHPQPPWDFRRMRSPGPAAN